LASQFVKFRINMSQLYLTVRIGAENNVFDRYPAFERINFGEISCHETKKKDGFLTNHRAECIFEHISSLTNKNFLIGYGLLVLDDYLRLKALLALVGRKIDKVFVSKQKHTNKSHEDQYSRWTGYTPAFLDNIHDVYINKLDILLDALESDGIEVIVLFN